jgi:hypothetical protein
MKILRVRGCVLLQIDSVLWMCVSFGRWQCGDMYIYIHIHMYVYLAISTYIYSVREMRTLSESKWSCCANPNKKVV